MLGLRSLCGFGEGTTEADLRPLSALAKVELTGPDPDPFSRFKGKWSKGEVTDTEMVWPDPGSDSKSKTTPPPSPVTFDKGPPPKLVMTQVELVVSPILWCTHMA